LEGVEEEEEGKGERVELVEIERDVSER